MLSMIFIMYPRAQVSAQRIAEVLDTKPSIKDGKVNSNETDKKGEIEFKNVSFKYPDGDDYVLKNNDLEKTVQIIMTIIENEKRIEDEEKLKA